MTAIEREPGAMSPAARVRDALSDMELTVLNLEWGTEALFLAVHSHHAMNGADSTDALSWIAMKMMEDVSKLHRQREAAGQDANALCDYAHDVRSGEIRREDDK